MRFLKAGTVQRLVESLANDDGELESTYINVFLATYRAFTTPREVLELLLARYDSLDEAANAQHRKTLVQALHVWLDAYPGDWRSPPSHPLLSRLLEFAHRRLPGSELEVKARHRLHRFSHREDQLGLSILQFNLYKLWKNQYTRPLFIADIIRRSIIINIAVIISVCLAQRELQI